MSVPRKRFEAHSPRWQKQASREGLTAARWNRFYTLKPATLRQVRGIPNAQRRYAAGESIRGILRTVLEQAVVDHFRRVIPESRRATVEAGAREMTLKQLRWTVKQHADVLAGKASVKPQTSNTRNPWWYR